MLSQIATLVSGLSLAACSLVGDRSGTEEPAYRVTDRVGEVEIRTYGARLAAETVVEADEEAARSTGFRRLAGYIFGGNRGNTSIAMTAPVATAAAGQSIAMTAPVAQTRDAAGRWVVRFYLPREWTMATLPVPNDPLVVLVTVPAETIAALAFTGDRGAEAVRSRQQELRTALAGGPWHITAEPVAWFYDPPWTLPWRRRNEVAAAVMR